MVSSVCHMLVWLSTVYWPFDHDNLIALDELWKSPTALFSLCYFHKLTNNLRAVMLALWSFLKATTTSLMMENWL